MTSAAPRPTCSRCDDPAKYAVNGANACTSHLASVASKQAKGVAPDAQISLTLLVRP